MARWVCLGKSGEGGGAELRWKQLLTFHGPAFPTVEYPLTLHCANISILEPRLCRRAYPGHISDSMLCAGLWEGGRGSCQVRLLWEGRGWASCSSSRVLVEKAVGAPDFLELSLEGSGIPGS